MRPILAATETTGTEFSVQGQYADITLAGHAGGTWTLERKTPEETPRWVATNVTFTEDNVIGFIPMPLAVYRLAGGDMGAVAWVSGNSDAFRG